MIEFMCKVKGGFRLNILKTCQELTKEIPSEQIYVNEPMSKHTTFKVGGNADIFIKVKNIDEFKYIIKIAKKDNIHITIIGNGSNILVKDNGIRGIVAKIEFEDINIEDNDDRVLVSAGAGVKLAILANKLMKDGISGFEFASGIPGTVGGAIKMNAGAYGSEMKDIVVSTKCIDLKNYNMITKKSNIDDIEIEEFIEKKDEPDVIELNNEQQKFEYRNSIFSDKRYVILESTFLLERGNKEDIQEKMNEYMTQRKEKQPNLPSAGSTFKRGEDFITAKLIDECGLKGYTIGGAQVSEKHAGFIVNTGNATAQNILELIQYVKDTVFNKTGKVIKLEVEVLGE